MGLLMADTVYDKINLRTGFVAPINRGGWTLMCSDARRARSHFTNICYNFSNFCDKFLWQVWSRLWYWESPLGGKMSGRIGHKTEMSPTFDYKLPMKTETASTWSNLRILRMFSWILLVEVSWEENYLLFSTCSPTPHYSLCLPF